MTHEELISLLVNDTGASEAQLRSFVEFCRDRSEATPLGVVAVIGEAMHERRSIHMAGGFPVPGTMAYQLYV